LYYDQFIFKNLLFVIQLAHPYFYVTQRSMMLYMDNHQII